MEYWNNTGYWIISWVGALVLDVIVTAIVVVIMFRKELWNSLKNQFN